MNYVREVHLRLRVLLGAPNSPRIKSTAGEWLSCRVLQFECDDA
jgi:hypothetical protein